MRSATTSGDSKGNENTRPYKNQMNNSGLSVHLPTSTTFSNNGYRPASNDLKAAKDHSQCRRGNSHDEEDGDAKGPVREPHSILRNKMNRLLLNVHTNNTDLIINSIKSNNPEVQRLTTMPHEILIDIIANTPYTPSMVSKYALTSRYLHFFVRENNHRIHSRIARTQFPRLSAMLDFKQYTAESLLWIRQQDIYMQTIIQHLAENIPEFEERVTVDNIIAGGLSIFAKLDAIRNQRSMFPDLRPRSHTVEEDILACISPLDILATIRITCLYLIHCIISNTIIETEDIRSVAGYRLPDVLLTEQAVLSLEQIAMNEGLGTIVELLKPVDNLYVCQCTENHVESMQGQAYHKLASQIYDYQLHFDLYVTYCDNLEYFKHSDNHSTVENLPGPFCMSSSLQLCMTWWNNIQQSQSCAEQLDKLGIETRERHLHFKDVVHKIDWLGCLHDHVQDKDFFLRQSLKSTEDIIDAFKGACTLYGKFEEEKPGFVESGYRTGFESFRAFKHCWQ